MRSSTTRRWLAYAAAVLAGAVGSAAPASADPHAHHGGHVPAPQPATTHPAVAMPDAFVVGTPAAPLIAGPVRGPLAAMRVAPAHGPVVAKPSTERSGPEVVATRAVLTKAEATKRLSKTCRRLVNAKRPSKLPRRDRKKRTACLEQRRELIARSKTQPPSTGVQAPPAAQPGPTPSTPPVTSAPDVPPPTTPASTTPASTTPTKPSGPTWTPCTPSGGTIGVTSFDAFARYTLTRACAPAGAVTFDFHNIDDTGSRPHNLFLAAVDASGEITGAPVEIVGLRDNGQGGSGTLTVKAGRYLLICTVDGHQGMNTPFQVY